MNIFNYFINMKIIIILTLIVSCVYSLPECGNNDCVNNTMCDNGYKCQGCYEWIDNLYRKTCIGI